MVPKSGMFVPEVGTKSNLRTHGVAGALFTPVQQRVLGLLFGQPNRSFQSAEIIRLERLRIGVTHSRRATLSLDGRLHDAHVQTVDVLKHETRVRGRTEPALRDCYRFNIAAYRLDRMLGLGMVPVSVERVVEGEQAAVTWWVDDVLMMERDRVERGIPPERPRSPYKTRPDCSQWRRRMGVHFRAPSL